MLYEHALQGKSSWTEDIRIGDRPPVNKWPQKNGKTSYPRSKSLGALKKIRRGAESLGRERRKENKQRIKNLND